MAFYPIRKVPVEQQRKVKLMRYAISVHSTMTVSLLEMCRGTELKGYDCFEWRLRKVTRTQKKSYSELNGMPGSEIFERKAETIVNLYLGIYRTSSADGTIGLKMFQKVAERGNAEAQSCLGVYYSKVGEVSKSLK